ncbi:MAG: HAMP domain-containing histidine kinase, partial [Gammaproteobacteria bacterium]|nr:HAMP domain-containing histidine kinase [Gammaproteobacteria bacterium]
SLEPGKRSQIVSKVVAQLGQLESLVDDMLMFSRSGYSGGDVIDVRTLLVELANTVAAVCDQRDIDVCLDCDPTPIAVKANFRILHSALLNLANNAIQAMGQGGTLRLQARPGVCGTVDLTVADDGPGVPEDIREKLFQPFFTTRSDGTGLGLAVVQAVARSHGGSVRLESPGAGARGSVFVVQLPLVQASDTAPTAQTPGAFSDHAPVAQQEVV